MIQIQNFINGQYVPPANGRYIDNFAPATGEVSGTIPDSDSIDVDHAVQAAKAAFPAWSAMPLEKRHDILRAISDGILHNLDRLAEAESTDSGKTLQTARTIDIPRAALNFKFFATAVLHFASESHHQPGSLSYTLRQPIGVVGCISPWNLPLYLFTWKIAPALAAGNCVIGKPSEITPLTAHLLGEICHQAGLPPGVLNIVHGLGPSTGAAIVSHPEVKAISFTGSTRAGAEIARVAAPVFKKLSLELGGKNPNIIFADCDYARMLDTTVRSSFNNQGQICLCGSRIYVEKSLYEQFKTDFVERVKKLKVGDPADPASNLGAVVSKVHYEKVLGCIALARQEGGTVLCGGEALHLPGALAGGYYIAPTIIEGLPTQCRTNQEEIFGPVVTIQPFDNDQDALNHANASPYGLSATLWTNNLQRTHQMAAQLQAGIVWVNTWMLRDLRTPFGGVKNSGIGREGGWEALRFFTEAKNVTLEMW
ncbi:MAG: aldehyde dehydrogenase [Saprospiraceae bacterium]|jgi:aminomuconate-semialdehyde/2-hydroxymuconate-6-semialdehyde dehydrogenase|nr:aldehyde dehydrogenase [Saprospiraceae bacterium]